MRIFFALWPPAPTARALGEWAKAAQRSCGGNPVTEDKIHLTLCFLGGAEPEKALRGARKVRAPSHSLPIEEARYWRDNRIVWAGPREAPAALLDLFKQLEFELYREQFALERRPFAAHVTLIRKARAAPLPPLPAVRWPVEEFALVRSKLSSAGSAYETLERFPCV
jgi:2'-5' RNA ligase